MKKTSLFIILFVLITSVTSYCIDMTIEKHKNKIHFGFGVYSPKDTYFGAAIHFDQTYIISNMFEFAIYSRFNNEVNVGTNYQENNCYNTQTWNAIYDYLVLRIGWKYTSNIRFEFFYEGGIDLNRYHRMKDLETGQTTEEIKGHGIVKTGIKLCLEAPIFYDKIYGICPEQFFEFQIAGNGSVSIENFNFGHGFYNWWGVNRPSEVSNWNPHKLNTFKYFGFRSHGRVGVNIPLQRHISAFSKFNCLEIKFDFDYVVGMKHFSEYVYYSEVYNVKSHFEPTGIGILMGLIFRPIHEIELYSHYKIFFQVAGTEWTDPDEVEYKNYFFVIEHQVEISHVFKLPRETSFKLGAQYFVKQEMGYQYMNDGENVRELIGDQSGGLNNHIINWINIMCDLSLKVVDTKGVKLFLHLGWNPGIPLLSYSPEEGIKYGYASGNINLNLLNLAVWNVSIGYHYW
ncbi:MAG: hypothetical protein KAT05_12195 [Spirochaetes bacterium]|nr:hypothetical protein [Spirochaetota bacterium]